LKSDERKEQEKKKIKFTIKNVESFSIRDKMMITVMMRLEREIAMKKKK
jgi:hypothetical protein